MCHLVAEWNCSSGLMSGAALQEAIEQQLKEAMVRTFDPRKADLVFTLHQNSAPQWLEGLISQEPLRAMVDEVKARHGGSCLLLNSAVQRIADAGHLEELARHPHTAATDLAVFEPVL